MKTYVTLFIILNHHKMFTTNSMRWFLASAVVPVGFYIGLSVRDSNDAEAKEQQRIDIVINQRLQDKKKEQQKLEK